MSIIDIGTSILGPFLWKGHEPVHFCHANYILISDRGTFPKVFRGVKGREGGGGGKER